MTDTNADIFAEPEPDFVMGAAGNLFEAKEERPTYVEDERRTETPPRPTSVGRTPLNELVSLLWGGVGSILQQSEIDIPAGRAMVFQADVAGSKLEELMKGTFVDRLLQPFAKKMESGTDAGAVLLFPVLVSVYWRKPHLAPAITPMLRTVISTNIVEMAPVLKKKARNEQKAAEALAELSDAFQLEEGQDPIQAVFESLFAAPPSMPTVEDVGMPTTEPVQ